MFHRYIKTYFNYCSFLINGSWWRKKFESNFRLRTKRKALKYKYFSNAIWKKWYSCFNQRDEILIYYLKSGIIIVEFNCSDGNENLTKTTFIENRIPYCCCLKHICVNKRISVFKKLFLKTTKLHWRKFSSAFWLFVVVHFRMQQKRLT